MGVGECFGAEIFPLVWPPVRLSSFSSQRCRPSYVQENNVFTEQMMTRQVSFRLYSRSVQHLTLLLVAVCVSE